MDTIIINSPTFISNIDRCNPMPTEYCCDALKIVWDKNMIDMLVEANKNVIMSWRDTSYRTGTSCECIFCGKKLTVTPNSQSKPTNIE